MRIKSEDKYVRSADHHVFVFFTLRANFSNEKCLWFITSFDFCIMQSTFMSINFYFKRWKCWEDYKTGGGSSSIIVLFLLSFISLQLYMKIVSLVLYKMDKIPFLPILISYSAEHGKLFSLNNQLGASHKQIVLCKSIQLAASYDILWYFLGNCSYRLF